MAAAPLPKVSEAAAMARVPVPMSMVLSCMLDVERRRMKPELERKDVPACYLYVPPFKRSE